MADLSGQTLGNYRILERIGRGGMASVYKAYQPSLERHVAVKVIHEQLAADDEQFSKRFQREAKAVASLRHPNIIQVFDFGTVGDVSYMVMEYVEGTTLKAKLHGSSERGETMPLEEANRIFQSVASALEYAHRQGMVHRDIKPANVMLTPKGEVILTDFGIARIVGGTRYTATGAVVGTPAYLSPEQGQGERGDERSDIYALGVVLYEMVTGQVPFDADTPLAVIFKHISDPLPPPRQLNPDVPEAVEQVILKALAKNPDDRYYRVADMARALKDAMASKPAPEPETRAPEPAVAEETAPPAASPSPLSELSERMEAPASEPPIAAAPQPERELQFPRRTWQMMALVMFVIAISWGACGLLFNAIPTEPSDVESASTGFWLTRGCCLGPAFVLLFLAYLAFAASRRKGHAIHVGELAAALGVAVGLVPTLLGLAIVVQPASSDPEGDLVFTALLCLLPGFFIAALSGILWFFARKKRRLP